MSETDPEDVYEVIDWEGITALLVNIVERLESLEDWAMRASPPFPYPVTRYIKPTLVRVPPR